MPEKDYKTKLDQSWQLRRDKKFREAELLLYEAMDEHSATSFEYKTLKANLADVILRQGNAKEAKTIALEVLDEDPRQVTALTVMGIAALEMNAPDEAVENLQKAYDLAPNPFRAGRLARAYELNAGIDKALVTLKDALQQYPDDHYLLKQFSSLEKRAGKASTTNDSDMRQVLPEQIDEENFIPYAENMKVKLNNIEPEKAVEQLEKILKIGKRKNNPHLHILLGDLLRKTGNEDGALEAYRQARELDPQNMLALSQLLYTYRRVGRKEEAWPLLKLLLYHRPADKTAKSSLLKDAVELGKTQETARFFEELLEKYPQRKEFYGAIRKLKQAADKSDEELL